MLTAKDILQDLPRLSKRRLELSSEEGVLHCKHELKDMHTC